MMFCLRFWQSQVLALQEAIARLMFVIPKGGSQGGISYAYHSRKLHARHDARFEDWP
jgi:hypothetical protein